MLGYDHVPKTHGVNIKHHSSKTLFRFDGVDSQSANEGMRISEQ